MPGLAELHAFWDGVVMWTSAIWRTLMPFLVAGALLLGPIMGALALYWVRSLAKALRDRRALMIVPTSRTERTEPRNYNTIVRTLSQIRLRRRHAIMQPAGAVRLAMYNANKLAVVHSMGGPPWMAGVLDVNNVTGVVVAPVELVDLNRVSPKSILPPPWTDADDDAPTMPISRPIVPPPATPPSSDPPPPAPPPSPPEPVPGVGDAPDSADPPATDPPSGDDPPADDPPSGEPPAAGTAARLGGGQELPRAAAMTARGLGLGSLNRAGGRPVDRVRRELA